MLASDMTAKPGRPARTRKPKAGRPDQTELLAESGVVPDGFYRDMVWNLRNGVIAITKDGRVAVMNDIAYRTLGLKPSAADIGRQYADVLGLCKVSSLKEIEAQGWSLNPGRYVGVAPGEDVSDEDFKAQFEALSEEFEKLTAEARKLEKVVARNTAEILEA